MKKSHFITIEVGIDIHIIHMPDLCQAFPFYKV